MTWGLLAGKRPGELGVVGGRLSDCPSSPNCVSSDARDAGHRVEPLNLALDGDEAWTTVQRVVAEMPGTELVETSPDYLYAECRSRWLGFVDDLELHWRPDERMIAVRSASRLGYSDLGVNRQRIEELRSRLADAGVVR